MAKKKFDRSLLIVFVILIVGFVISYFGFVGPYLSRRKEIKVEINQKTQELELFREEKGGVTSLELIESLKADQKDYQNKIASLKEYFGDFEIDLPPEVTQKGLFFTEKVYQSERRLREKAEDKKVILPATLGFDKGVPKEEEAERLLWELAAIEKVVETLIESRMDSLVSLDLKPIEKCSEAGLDYTCVPIEIKCQGNTRSLLNFVHSLSRANFPLIIEKMDVKEQSQTGKKEKIEVDLTIQGVYLQ